MAGNQLKIIRRTFLQGLGASAALSTFATHAFSEVNKMTKYVDRNYIANLTEYNCGLVVYFNGAEAFIHGGIDPLVETKRITSLVRDGVNRLDIDFEPRNVETQTYTFHEGVKMIVSLMPNLGATTFEDITLLTTRYDVEKEQMVTADVNYDSGLPPKWKGNYVSGSPKFSITKSTIEWTDKTSTENVQRLSTEFTIRDPSLRDVAWAKAPALKDTAKMREKLYQAHQDLYDSVVNKDFAAYLEITRPYMERGAYTSGFAKNAEDFAKSIFEALFLDSETGDTLGPLPNRAFFKTERLSFGPTNQLVKYVKDTFPLVSLSTREQSGALIPYFAMDSDGSMRVFHFS